MEYGDGGGCNWPGADVLVDKVTNCFPLVGKDEDDAIVNMISRAVVNAMNAY